MSNNSKKFFGALVTIMFIMNTWLDLSDMTFIKWVLIYFFATDFLGSLEDEENL